MKILTRISVCYFLSLGLYSVALAEKFPRDFQNVYEEPNNGNLNVYDSCEGTWRDTGLSEGTVLEREDDFTPRKPYFGGNEYKIGEGKVQIREVDLYQLEDYMDWDNSDLPLSFKGLWWMDGNPVPEVVVAFGAADFDEDTNSINFDYNAPGAYTLYPSLRSQALWESTYRTGSKGLVQFDSSMDLENPMMGDTGQLSLRSKILGIPLDIKGMSVTYVKEGLWQRVTTVATLSHCYNLRRIVDENGQKLPAYNHFIEKTQKEALDAGIKKIDRLIQAIKVPKD